MFQDALGVCAFCTLLEKVASAVTVVYLLYLRSGCALLLFNRVPAPDRSRGLC